jgi:hypothetical protein
VRSHRYNVIFMRDDTPVRSFRLSPLWLKLLFIFFLLLIIVSMTGVYWSFVFFQEKKQEAGLYQLKVESFEQMKKELNRLQNVEKILENYNEHELRSFLVNHQQEQREQAQEVSSADVDLRVILDSVDKNIVGVSNVRISFVQNRMRVQLEVNNMQGKGPVSGAISLYLIKNNGDILNLDLEESDLRYSITRFRTMDNTFDLPESLDHESIFGLRVTAKNDENYVVYTRVFPVSSILI